ncbi:MAG: ABC transporter substrate-binding protein [Lachnospirales bacterium]
MLKNFRIKNILCFGLSIALLAGCGSNSQENTDSEESGSLFSGEELSIIVSAGWMDNRYDEVISNFENDYDVTVDLQTIPAEQYPDILQSKLDTGTNSDIFWIQSNPFAIETAIVYPEEYCIDFTGSKWENLIPESRLSSCKYNDKLYGLQLWHNSPEYVMLYNKTLFDELGLEAPTTFEEFKRISEKINNEGITPWFIPGADGWQHQLAFFQIGGVYEQNQSGLYEGLNTNKATFADNQTMLTALSQIKEFSDLGYLGNDWIGSDSTNMINDFGERNIAMAMANSSLIDQIKTETGTSDEFGLFLLPLADNQTFPTNPAGPTMFGYKNAKNPDLVKAFFDYVTTTESLQSILDNSPQYTNIAVNDENVQQHWVEEEEVFMENITDEQMTVSVLQSGTKYTNDFWMDFGADMVAYCLGQIEANDVLKNMDTNRAEAAKLANDPNWQ